MPVTGTAARTLRALLVLLLVLTTVLVTAGSTATQAVTAPPASLRLDPNPVSAGRQVALSGDGYAGSASNAPDTCIVLWAGRRAGDAQCSFDGRRLLGSLLVPASTQDGPVEITVCRSECSPYVPQGRSTLQVRRPPVDVPDLTGQTQEQAVRTLSDRRLRLGEVVGEGLVVDQRPPPLTSVDEGSAVAVTLRPAPVLVPDVRGQTREQAQRTLDDAGLRVGAVTGTGEVTDQDPRAGQQVDAGSAVDLTLAPVPPQPVPVPDLTGHTRQEAEKALQAVGLRLGAVTGDGQVAVQEPTARTPVPAGSAVDVTLRPLVPTPATVPRLSGLTPERAAQALEAAGLRLGEVRGSGRVAGQDPSAGERVDRGTAVDVSLRLPAVGTVPVPDLSGQTREQAARALASVGLRLGEVDGEGTVDEQRPVPGTRFDRGGAVDVNLETAASEPPVPVPDLVGQTREEAAQALGAVGLRLGAATGDGRVERSLPQAGTAVERGTAVDVTLGVAPPAPATVPELSGLTREQAAQELGSVGLRLGEVDGTGEVSEQLPVAGTVVDRGTPVDLTLTPAPLPVTLRPAGTGWRRAGLGALVLLLAAVLLRGLWPLVRPPRTGASPRVLPLLRPRVDVRPYADAGAAVLLREVVDLDDPVAGTTGPAVHLRANADEAAPVRLEEVPA